MGGFFGVASKQDCVLELFYGVDYHSHLGTRRGGMATFGEDGVYDQKDSAGFINLYGLPTVVRAKMQAKVMKEDK